MQVITIMGNLTADAVEKNGNDNSKYVSFRVACNSVRGDSTTTTYYDVTKRPSAVDSYLKTGQKVTVVGRLNASARLGDEGKVFLNLNIAAFDLQLAGSKN